MAETILKLAISAVLFIVIEVVDHYATSFSIHWLASAAIALVLVFGGLLLLTDGDLDLD